MRFATCLKESIADVEACFIAVDTPVGENGEADLSRVREVVTEIAQHMTGYQLIINKSTVPIGTAKMLRYVMATILEARGVSYDFDLVSNPEFLKEGSAVSDFMKPDRVILGVSTDRALQLMKEIYSPFMLRNERIVVMDIASAEMTKYAANLMLATRISLMNELAGLCELTGADISKVRLGIGSDHRIGYDFLYAGAGFGGSCLPKDLRALRTHAQTIGYETLLVDAVNLVNIRQKESIADRISEYFRLEHGLNGKVIGILGLSFKPDTDDIREAPALVLIERLALSGAILRVYDPVAMPNARKKISSNIPITWCENESEVAIGADGVVLMTEWKQFRFLDFPLFRKLMRGHLFFDTRNQYCADDMVKRGFDYLSIGKPPAYISEKLSKVGHE